MKRLTIDDIVETVCAATNNRTIDILYNKTRKQEIVDCRQMIYFFIRKYIPSNTRKDFPYEYKLIGNYFKKDHATILAAVKKVNYYIKYDKKYRELMQKIDNTLMNMHEITICPFCGTSKDGFHRKITATVI